MDELFPAENVARLLAEIDQPLPPPEPITLEIALALDPDGWWPCADWCCTLGCPGPGNSLCRTPGDDCPGWCTCGSGPTRDVVRLLQSAPPTAPTRDEYLQLIAKLAAERDRYKAMWLAADFRAAQEAADREPMPGPTVDAREFLDRLASEHDDTDKTI